MVGNVGFVLVETAIFSGIWRIGRVNVKDGFWRVPVLYAFNAVRAVYLHPAKTLMPKAKKFEARKPAACGGGHIVAYMSYHSSPITHDFCLTAKTLILLYEESPSPIYIGSSWGFGYLEGTCELGAGVGREYQSVRQLLKTGFVL
jgi:hypothetical protein